MLEVEAKGFQGLSGHGIVGILVRKLGFNVERQRGSHIVLVEQTEGRKLVAIVPLHQEELKPGAPLGVRASRDE